MLRFLGGELTVPRFHTALAGQKGSLFSCRTRGASRWKLKTAAPPPSRISLASFIRQQLALYTETHRALELSLSERLNFPRGPLRHFIPISSSRLAPYI